MLSESPSQNEKLVSTGVAALDYVLRGGLPAHHLYLIQGNPGSGKTTLGLQFLLEGVRLGQQVLCVTLSETQEELQQVAESHGWSLDGIAVHELTPNEDSLRANSVTSMFQPSEVELTETTELILRKVEQLKPSRVVFDSLSELRLLAQSALRYRRQILALKQFFIGRKATVLMLDDNSGEQNDLHLQSLVHGVIDLQQLQLEYGPDRRRLRISKLRGVPFKSGFHDFVIRRGGIQAFPRIVAAGEPTEREDARAPLSSGLTDLDNLIGGGGISRGSSVLLMGPAGAGKSTVAFLYAVSAAARGERAAAFIFDESTNTLFKRVGELLPSFREHYKSGRITVSKIAPAEISPGEFGERLRLAAEGKDGHPPASVVIIDTLNAYLTSMPEERFLLIQLHELLSVLGRRGVITMVVMAQHGIFANAGHSPIDTSYLSDLVVLLRYFESKGEIRQAISIVKNRTGQHERTIREFTMRGSEIQVGKPLVEFDGVLTGTPRYRGAHESLVGEQL